MKSNLLVLELQKLPFCHSRGCEFCYFGKFQPWEITKIHKNQNLECSKCGKMAHFVLQESSKSISRKIWIIQKTFNFHTLLCRYTFHCHLLHFSDEVRLYFTENIVRLSRLLWPKQASNGVPTDSVIICWKVSRFCGMEKGGEP